MEERYPGLWFRWYQGQAVAVGWPPKFKKHAGWSLNGKPKGRGGWKRARSAIKRVEIGDYVVVQLKNNRIGRIGEVFRKKIEDDEWNPLVPPSSDQPIGEQGRRILVRWDIANGPLNPDLVVQLPRKAQLSPGVRLSTINRISKSSFNRIAKVYHDPKNWVSILPHIFRKEKAISDYIGTYPHHMEEGLQPYPDMKVREHVFSDGVRSDVLLIDKNNSPVVVECKQNSPSKADIDQLRGYMNRTRKIIGQKPRGILIHGGPIKLPADVKRYGKRNPKIEIIQYSVAINFQ
ncbi:MAG: DUF91 domain-containing protein [Planctomycetes bacterium]|nr:DUF91 domain-containing protein [Planctomycetota bacterium]